MHPDHLYIQFTDTHIHPGPGDLQHGVDTAQTLRDCIAAVSAAGLRPEAFIISGDLTDKGEPAAYSRLRGMVAEIEHEFGVPVLLAMGNHDTREPMYQYLLGEEASGAPYHYSRMVGDVRFIVLDSSVPGHHYGALGDEQRAWLRAELETTPVSGGTIVVFHHPPVPGPIPILNSMILSDRAELEPIITGSDVIGILNGHVHHPVSSLFGGVMAHAASATAYTVDPLYQVNGFRGVSGPGFSVIQLYGRHLIATAVAMPATRDELYRYEMTQEQWDAFVARMASGQAPAESLADDLESPVEAVAHGH